MNRWIAGFGVVTSLLAIGLNAIAGGWHLLIVPPFLFCLAFESELLVYGKSTLVARLAAFVLRQLYKLTVTRTTEPIIAYRAWRINPPRAHSLPVVEMKFLWPMNLVLRSGIGWGPRKRMEAADGKATALETAAREQRACLDPLDLDGGIHAFKELGWIFTSYKKEVLEGLVIFGRVALWGRVEAHEHGYRARYAYPQLFYKHPVIDVQSYAEAWGVETAEAPEELLLLLAAEA